MLRFEKGIDVLRMLAMTMLLNATSQSAVIISEINYHPLEGEELVDKNLYEFIEIKNTGISEVNLSGYCFNKGITYSFPAETKIGAGEFIVLATDELRFEERYGFAPFGIYAGKLDNSGERITLSDTIRGKTIFSVSYGTNVPWPSSADGAGFSLVPVNPNGGTGSPDDAYYWRASSAVRGSPGSDDPSQTTISPVLINEVLTHTDEPEYDAIEIYNPNSTEADISGWYLTDDKQNPKKYQIPAGTVLSPNSYMVFDERQFNKLDDPLAFSLSAHGDGVFIFSASQGTLTGYSHGFTYGEIDNGTTFGRIVTSTGEEHFPAMAQATLGQQNSLPRNGPVIVTEVNYNPSNGLSYIEIKNISAVTVDLFDPLRPANTWQVGGVGFSFPQNTSLLPGEVAVIIAALVDPHTFKAVYGLSADTKVFSYTGTLSTSGESITIRMPCEPYLEAGSVDSIVPYMDIDKISYSSDTPWPVCADGYSLSRKAEILYANDPANWIATATSPGVPVLHHSSSQQKKTFSVSYRKNRIQLRFLDIPADPISYSVLSLNGKILYRGYKFIAPDGDQSITIDARLPKGIYMLKVESGRYTISEKVVTTSSASRF